MLVGAVKDSIVSEDRLVRYLLQELARQPQFAGVLQHVPAFLQSAWYQSQAEQGICDLMHVL